MNPSVIVIMIGSWVFLLLWGIWIYTQVYVRCPSNEAFVRSGGVMLKRTEVILSGGCIILPGFHELTRVPLAEFAIEVECSGAKAVRIHDGSIDLRLVFYVCIDATPSAVMTAAARLSHQGSIPVERIKNALEHRAENAIRIAAQSRPFKEIDTHRTEFSQTVREQIEPDLKKVGLTLNSTLITEICKVEAG